MKELSGGKYYIRWMKVNLTADGESTALIWGKEYGQ